MADKYKEAAAKPKAPAPLPNWTNGEYPMERAFFGHGEAPLGAESSQETARAAAMKMLKMELALLTRGIKIDHEEQVAEIISRYSPEEFNKHVAGAVEDALAKAEVRSTHESDSRKRLYVLYTLPVDAFFDALYARQDLPQEQKSRVRDYRETFVDAAMLNLSRMEEE